MGLFLEAFVCKQKRFCVNKTLATYQYLGLEQDEAWPSYIDYFFNLKSKTIFLIGYLKYSLKKRFIVFGHWKFISEFEIKFSSVW